VPVALGGQRAGVRLGQERPDRLARRAEGRVVGVDDDVRDERDGGPRAEAAVQGAHEQAAELALGHRAQRVQGLGRGLLPPGVLLQREGAHLRAVAVDDGEPPAGGAQRGQARRHRVRGLLELLAAAVLAGAGQRVAADGDHGGARSGGHGTPSSAGGGRAITLSGDGRRVTARRRGRGSA